MIFSSHAVEAAEIKFNGLLLKAGEEKRNEILSRLSEAEKNVSRDPVDVCQQPLKRYGKL